MIKRGQGNLPPSHMKESSFIVSVHRHLDDSIIRQSMTGASMNTNGTPDRYYDSEYGIRDLWVEYKYWVTVPKLLPRMLGEKSGQVTALQHAWLTRRWKAGMNAYVIVGTQINYKTHGAIVPANQLVTTPHLKFIPVAEVSAWINNFVLKGYP